MEIKASASTETNARSRWAWCVSLSSHLAHEHKLVDHAQDEISPEDVQRLQHQQQRVEEVIAGEGPEKFSGHHQRPVENSGKEAQRLRWS